MVARFGNKCLESLGNPSPSKAHIVVRQLVDFPKPHPILQTVGKGLGPLDLLEDLFVAQMVEKEVRGVRFFALWRYAKRHQQNSIRIRPSRLRGLDLAIDCIVINTGEF